MRKVIFAFLAVLLSFMAYAQDGIMKYELSVQDGPVSSTKVVLEDDMRLYSLELTLSAELNERTNQLHVYLEENKHQNYYVWFPQNEIEHPDFVKLKNIFKSGGRRLSFSPDFKKQQQKLPSTVVPSVSCSGCKFETYLLERSMADKAIDTLILPLGTEKKMELVFSLEDNPKTVCVNLNNLMVLTESSLGGRKLQFVAKDFVLSFAVAKDPCAGMVERLKYLSELKEIFRIGFERLSNKFDSRMQNLLLDQYAKIDTSAFINTGCPDIDTAFSVLKYRIREIKETTSKKPKPTVKTDVEEIETLVKDYILEMNYSFNNGDKERFNELVKKTDALLKNLTKSDKNKIKDTISRYEAAKAMGK